MAEVTIQQRWTRSREIWGAATVTVLFAVTALVAGGAWPAYLAALAILAISWWLAVSRLRRTWLRVTGTELEISEPPNRVVRVPRASIRRVEAHPGDAQFTLLGEAGPVGTLRGTWFVAETEALGQALGVPVCRDPGPQCRRTP